MIAYEIKNFGDPTYLVAKVTSFEPKDNLGNLRLKNELEGPIRFSLDNADVALNQPFFLKSGASQQLLLKIRVPEKIEEGDYYYTLIAETIPPSNLTGSTASIARVTLGSNILISVTETGVIEIKPRIVLFEVISKMRLFGQKINLFDSFEKVPIVLIVENRGRNLIKPEGEIILKNFFGELRYQIIPKNILSQSQRIVEASSSSSLPGQKQTNNKQATSLILSDFLFGKVNLSAEISFGENSPKLFANTSFFAFPFRLTLLILAGAIVTAVIIKKLKQQESL